MDLVLTLEPTTFLRSTGGTILTRCDVSWRKGHFVVVLINICELRVSDDRSVGNCVRLSDDLLVCPSVHFVCPLIYRSIGGPSVYLCLSIGVSDSSLIDRSVNAYCCLLFYWCVPPSILSICWQIDTFFDRSINRWILMSNIWNRHGLSVDFFPSIGVSKYPLIYQSDNSSWCILYYWCVHPSILSVRWYINWLIDQSIGEYWCLWLEIDTALPRHPLICVCR